MQWSTQYETTLQINVDADTDNGLLINNVATRTTAFGGPQPVSLYATQKRLDNGDTTPPIPIDFVMERLEPVHAPEDPLKMIVPVKFTIVGFGGHPVKVDTLSIDVLQSANTMKVMRIDKVPFIQTPGAASCEGESAWSYCRVRAIIAYRVNETMRIMREKAQKAKGWVKSCGNRGGYFRRPGHGPGHGRHGHHHHRAHRWAKMLHSTLRFFVIPALLGVIGGLLASAVGMLVGQFIVFLWLRFGRQGQRGPLGREVVEITITEDEKDGLLEYEEDLPAPPPRYEDVEAQEVEPEKE